MSTDAWPRVDLIYPPCPSGWSAKETESALMAVCAAMWKENKIPVVAWGSDMDGTELLPPVKH